MPTANDKNPGFPPQAAELQLMGSKLMAAKLITETQLLQALERQKTRGGRLGENLVELGFLTLEAFNRFLRKHPDAPNTVKETGLELSFLIDLVLKHILSMGEFVLADVSASVKLPVSVVDEVVEHLQKEKLVEVKGATQFVRSAYRFTISGQGYKRAAELLDICRYTGPAPVPLEDYRKMVLSQTVKTIDVHHDNLKKAFSNLVVSEPMLKRLGPAVMSGKSIFMYGPPGNGKSSIAEAIANALDETVYIPHSILAGGGNHQRLRSDQPYPRQTRGRRGGGRQTMDLCQKAGGHGRWRTDPEDPGPGIQPHFQVLPGPSAAEGEQRPLHHRRLRKAADRAEIAPEPLDRSAGEEGGFPDPSYGDEIRDSL